MTTDRFSFFTGMKSRLRYARESYVLDATRIGPAELYLTVGASQAQPSSAAAAYREIADFLSQGGLQVIQERIFGTLSHETEILEARRREFAAAGLETDTPVTYIQGDPWHGAGFAGVQLQARGRLSVEDKIWTLTDNGTPCGRLWRSQGNTFVSLQSIHGAEGVETSPARQAECMLDRAERILRSAGLSYQQVVRTWIYLADILDWYGQFNAVRNGRYQQWGLMPAPGNAQAGKSLLLPCSTGIRGKNRYGSACVLDLLAIATQPGNPPPYRQLSNPSQQDAFRYGSAFSRGVVIQQTQGIQFHLSGTAAIDAQGKSEFVGDARAQIEATLNHIETLIAPMRLTLRHICGATVFLKQAEHASIYREVALRRGLEELPGIYVVADVCRPELLFEMDAVFASPQGQA